jgi:hypothetical protein
LADCQAKFVVQETVSKRAIILILVAAAMALAITFGVFSHDDRHGKRTVPAPSEGQDSLTEPTPPVVAHPDPLPRLPRSPAPEPTATPRPQTPGSPPVSVRLDEPSLIAKLHDLAASDPPQSLKLARDALARYPDSSHAPEFQWNVVKALANMDRYREAEDEARRMLEKYPDNPFSVDIEHHVLNHPPNPPGTP